MCLLLSSHSSYERSRNTMTIVFEFTHEGVCMCMHTVSSNIL